MKQKLISITTHRIVDELESQNPVSFLHKMDIGRAMDAAVELLYLYTRGKKRLDHKSALLTEVAVSVGHRVRTGMPRDTGLSLKTGVFLLYSFEVAGIIKVELGQGTGMHATYVIKLLDDDTLSRLWSAVEINKTEKLPSLTPVEEWTSSRNSRNLNLVKTESRRVLTELTPETHPIIFNAVNKLQSIPWQINQQVYTVAAWALRNKADAFQDIWSMQNEEAKQSKLRETHAIAGLAKRFLGKTFYHTHTMDFRGRVYTSTAYLSHQGTDFSKGLLLRADSKEIGEQGVYWLLVSIASFWGGDAGREDGAKTDKMPLQDRVYWVLENEMQILSYAVDYKKNRGWFEADKPWQFLAACFELKKLREWQVFMKATRGNNHDPYAFKSSFTAYLDGSNNGVQHICALTKDEITAPHANLVPLALPGDLYSYIAEHVWEKLQAVVAAMSEEDKTTGNEIIDKLIEMKKAVITAEPNSEPRRMLQELLYAFKSEHSAAMKEAAPLFWYRITDRKHKRKIAKRNTMTLSYGATPYGMGSQIQADSRKHGIELLNYSDQIFSTYLGRLIFEDCKVSMKRPMRLLETFERAGKVADEEEAFLEWVTPITNFLVVQHYTEGTVKKIWAQYGPPNSSRMSTGRYENTLQLNVCFNEEPQVSPNKQSSGASPNIIHSLDACHLHLVVDAADFGMAVVHDSFGCLLADMPKLFVLVREKFVEMHEQAPLPAIMKSIKGDMDAVETGTLDVKLVLQSEYAFS